MTPLSFLLAVSAAASFAEPLAEDQRSWARAQIEAMKQDPRGPYQGVLWHCADGTTQPPRPYACAERGGGRQHGVFKLEARRLASLGIYVGTILAATTPEELLRDRLYRARALVLERYLERMLDGWVLKLAKTHRGARQIEDEQPAARTLLMALMQRGDLVIAERALAIRLIRALPYGEDATRADEIRGLAAELGDADPRFAPLRFKIHTLPEPRDAVAVTEYAAGAPEALREKTAALLDAMRVQYDPSRRRERLTAIRGWLPQRKVRVAIDDYLALRDDDTLGHFRTGSALVTEAAAALRPGDTAVMGERNLLHLQILALIEQRWVEDTAALEMLPLARGEALDLVYLLLQAAQSFGVLSPRELGAAQDILTHAREGSTAHYVAAVKDLGRVVDWMRARYLSMLGLPLARYQSVEPKSTTAIDDMVRSGVSVPLASLHDRLTRDAARLGARASRLVGIASDSGAGLRGENPGLAVGKLRALEVGADAAGLNRDEIALLGELVPELPPVAGILTPGGGGSLSHVALLARNLGVPHASASQGLMDGLRPWVGKDVVLGVSAGRNVVFGPLASFPVEEQQRLRKPTRVDAPSLTIDARRLDLVTARILTLDEVSEVDAGVRVGPKAAELGRLHRLFPEHVADAVVLPFGLFVRHVDRPAADGGPSPLGRLRRVYEVARAETPERAEAILLDELTRFREAIATLPFDAGFEASVRAGLGKLGPAGTVGVFVRSDTNVEDLKDFTGAGLNLTVPNRVKPPSILGAIREVWASPFSERAYRWRQRILSNPEHVYPSVILHRTVPAEVSGVLVTADIETGERTSWTVSAGEGVAAVVDGGLPETLVIDANGTPRLLSSSRTVLRKRIPRPPVEGVLRDAAMGTDPLLDAAALGALGELVAKVRAKMPPSATPWDVEYGFVGRRLYLMQIRPLRSSNAPALEPMLVALDASAKVTNGALSLDEVLP